MAIIRAIGRFWRGLCTNAVGTAGVVLTTSGFLLFMVAELMRVTGVVTNSYVGLITYLLFPAIFVLGLLLIPLGWWRYRRSTGRSTRELLAERFDDGFVAPRPAGSRLVAMIALFTLINILFLGIGSVRMLHFMDQPEFCGTACHRVMNPEWTVYHGSPHARVACVDCHVGEGADALIDAKLNGLWQMVSATFHLYERPIPTPVHNLRPARETCERCHWPEVFYGDRIRRITRHADDEASTPRYTTLSLKIGSGAGETRGEIHWHVAERNQVRYLAGDDQRMTMQWVEVRRPDGSTHRYDNRRPAPVRGEKGEPREARAMDCVDCHNRATHIYHDPVDAVDRLIAEGRISGDLPWARRRAIAALMVRYPASAETPADSVERDFRRSEYAGDREPAVAVNDAVAALRATFERNIHPYMNVGWNAYVDHLGHRGGAGCRRCHHVDMVDSDGRAVPHDCTLCHSILAWDSPSPFHYLGDPAADDPEAWMHRYLGREFLGPHAGTAGDLASDGAEMDGIPEP